MLTPVSVAAMNLLLDEVASQLPPGTHAAKRIDNAGWHTANDLRVPPNITLVHLPSCSPELNAIETVWQHLRGRHLSGRRFAGTRDIVDACRNAWNHFVAETGRIRSLTDFVWARRANSWCAGYQSHAIPVRGPRTARRRHGGPAEPGRDRTGAPVDRPIPRG